jgi:hypothetical protein
MRHVHPRWYAFAMQRNVTAPAPKTMVFSHIADRMIPLFPDSDVKRAAELSRKPGVKVVVATERMSLSL